MYSMSFVGPSGFDGNQAMFCAYLSPIPLKRISPAGPSNLRFEETSRSGHPSARTYLDPVAGPSGSQDPKANPGAAGARVP